MDLELNVQLIQPALNPGYATNSRTGCYAPLGLVSIAGYVKSKFSSAEIQVLDGELIGNEAVINRLIPGSVVGIETKLPNYFSAVQIAEAAKALSCKVVFGGVYASAMANVIAKNRESVDQVVAGFGEIPFVEILSGRTDRIIYNPKPNFNDLLDFDRSFVDMKDYVNNHTDKHPTWGRAANIFTSMGCRYKCLFCSRSKPGTGIYFREPIKIWKEVDELGREYGIDYIVDFSDSLTQDLNWLRKLADSKPAAVDAKLHVFSNAADIDNQIIELFKQLGVSHTFIGFETGDEQLSACMGKGQFNPDISLKAVQMLSDSGITITPSFVLGLPGETEQTLDKTLRMAEQIAVCGRIEEIFCSGLIPFPGSPAYEKLNKRDSFDTDMLDAEELRELWVSRFCNVDYDVLRSYVNKILDLGKYTISIRKE